AQAVRDWSQIQRTGGEQQVEPPLAAPAQQVLATSAAPAAIAVEPQQQPAVDPPNQLNAPTPLVPQVIDQPVLLPHGPLFVAAPREFDKRSYPLYVIEPPDILQIQSSKALLDQPITLTRSE